MNYLMMNGKRIDLTPQQVAEIEKSFASKQTKLANIKIGDTFKIGDYEFIVLEHSKETTAVILKELLYQNERFGDNNNFSHSHALKLCEKFAKTISSLVGKDNLIEHTVDLTSDDGLKDYGKITRQKMSLLTTDLYRRYVEILDKHKINAWWWLATAYSTPTHNNSSWVKCVSPSGYIGSYFSYSDYFGVRPFCILNSNIFVSK